MPAEVQLLVFSGVTDFTPNTASGRKREVTLTLDGNSTSPVDLDTNALSVLQAAAEGLAGIGAGNVTLAATTSSGWFAIQVTYAEVLGDVPQMTASMECGFIASDWSVTRVQEPSAEVMEDPGQALVYTIAPNGMDDVTYDTLGGSATMDSGGMNIVSVSTPSGFSITGGGEGFSNVQFTESGTPQGLTVDKSAGAGTVSTDVAGSPYVPYSPAVNQIVAVQMPSNPTPLAGEWRPDSLGVGTDIAVTAENATVGGACSGAPNCTTSGSGAHGNPYNHELEYSGGSYYDSVVPVPTGEPSQPSAVCPATASTTQQGGGGAVFGGQRSALGTRRGARQAAYSQC